MKLKKHKSWTRKEWQNLRKDLKADRRKLKKLDADHGAAIREAWDEADAAELILSRKERLKKAVTRILPSVKQAQKADAGATEEAWEKLHSPRGRKRKAPPADQKGT